MYTRASIRQLLATNPKAVRRGILVLFARQTNDEQDSEQTRYRNYRGFSASNAKRGSEIADKFRNNITCNAQDWADARHICHVHARQLAAIANANAQRLNLQPA